jgi:hypothetical protein
MNRAIKPLAILLLLFAVFTARVMAQTNKPTGHDGVGSNVQLLLASLLVEKTAQGYAARLNNVRVVAGAVKQPVSKQNRWVEGDLICLIPGSNPFNSDTCYLGRPFQTRFEYPGDDGTIGSVTQHAEKASLLLRIPWQEGAGRIGLALYGTDNRFNRIADLPVEIPQQIKTSN